VSGSYELLLSGAARRSLERELPVAIALAVWEFCDGPLRENSRRVGKPLGRELTGYFSARRGAYRVIYALVKDGSVVHVVRIEHRADVYRCRRAVPTAEALAIVSRHAADRGLLDEVRGLLSGTTDDL